MQRVFLGIAAIAALAAVGTALFPVDESELTVGDVQLETALQAEREASAAEHAHMLVEVHRGER